MPDKILYQYVDVTVRADVDNDVTIDADGTDYLDDRQTTELRNALSAHLAREGGPEQSKPETADRVLASKVSFNEGLLRLAAVHGKTVTFRYAKGDGSNIEQRSLRPSEVKVVGGKTLFIGFDPDRDEPRAYRVDRMKGEVSVA